MSEQFCTYRFFSALVGPVLLSCWVAALCITACGEEPAGLAPAVIQEGAPVVVFEPEARPLPEIPLPNDLATRLDPTEPFTGRRLNVSLEAPTRVERDVRRKAAMTNGFGTFMPITVSFTRPLDISNLVKRHRDNVDFSDDAVYVVDVTDGSPTFGQPVLLDMGRGNFPVILPQFDKYFQNDPRSMTSNVLFETVDEDVNLNGKLDPGEDTDHDGILDHPNVFPVGGDQVDDLLTFYERETNTLIMRPVVPLRQETTYAVVLTDRLTGDGDVPVASPFPGVNHLLQNGALEGLSAILAGFECGVGLEDVAFAWTFTTQSVTRELEALREGLYGRGLFGWLDKQYPVSDVVLRKVRGTGQPAYIVRLGNLLEMLGPLIGSMTGDDEASMALVADLKNIDYLVAGLFRTPFFLEDKDGIATPNYPADEDESFDMDVRTGEAVVGERWVPFICAIPKKADNCANGRKPVCTDRVVCDDGECGLDNHCSCQPYPVIIYTHGYGGMKYEALGFAGRHAAFGLATCAIDAHGHGMDITRLLVTTEEGEAFPVGDILLPFLGPLDLPGLKDILSDHRARDLNNDGVPDPAADFWTYDVFHTRDVVRQTVVDHIQFIKLLRSFDGEMTLPFDMDGDGKVEAAGDFDGDGLVDLGGREVKYFSWGQSMGGILTPILAAVEPIIEGVAPVAGGAGLFDLAMRSTNPGVPEAVFIPLLGPFVIGEKAGSGGAVQFSFLVQDSEDSFPVQLKLPFYETTLKPGDRVVLRNTVNGEEDWAIVDSNRNFRLSVASDALCASEKHFVAGIDDWSANAPVAVFDTQLLGDTLELTIFDGPTDMLLERVIQFGKDVLFQGVSYKAGSPLVAPMTGFGLKRGTPELRRFVGFASMFVEPGDPVGYVPHLLQDHLESGAQEQSDLARPGAHLLFIPTAGDMNVPVNSGLSMARAAGVIETLNPSDEYCVTLEMCEGDAPDGAASALCRHADSCLTENQLLIATHVYEGLARLRRFSAPPWNDQREVLFDPDDLDDGALPWYTCETTDSGKECFDGEDAPDLGDLGWSPLRLTADDRGAYGMRVFFSYRSDQHGFEPPAPQWPVDMNTYFSNLIGNFFYRISTGEPSSEKVPWILDDACMADSSCKQFP